MRAGRGSSSLWLAPTGSRELPVEGKGVTVGRSRGAQGERTRQTGMEGTLAVWGGDGRAPLCELVSCVLF